MKICEIFKSIQGEGLMMGAPTVFIRTVGCNLKCTWCDTQYAMTGGKDMTIDEIMSSIGGCKNICFTGGEPLLQDDAIDLIEALVKDDRKVVLETNGSISLDIVPKSDNLIISMDIKCPSSKMDGMMIIPNLKYLSEKDQLKFIILNQTDLDYAINFVKSHPTETNIIFGPVGGTDKMEWLVDAVMENNLNVRVLPQLHKIIWGEKPSV